MRHQTTVQNSRELMFGSGTLYVYVPAGAYVTNAEIDALIENPISAGAQELGAMDNIKFKETIEYINSTADNCDLGEFVKKQECNITGDWLEFSLSKMKLLRGGIDLYTTGGEITHTGDTQSVTTTQYNFNDFIPFANQSYDKTIPTNISVSAAVSGTLAANSDYFIVEDSAGQWGIAVVDGPTLSAKENLTITYTWKEAGYRRLTSGGKTSMTPIVVMIRNINESDEPVDLIGYKCYYQDGMDMTYQSDEADKPNAFAINMLGKTVKERNAGDQLFCINDQRKITG